MVAYRGFSQPAFSLGDHELGDWLAWLDELRLVRPVAPIPEGACERCFGAVGGIRYDGLPFGECVQCHDVPDDPLDGFVPIAYSTDDTIESMLHRFKDWKRYHWADYTWLQLPLGALLATFWRRHESCLTQAFGHFDLTVAVPSDDSQRGFDQLAAINHVTEAPTLDLTSGVIERNFAEERPRRQEIRPSAYTVPRVGDVHGSRMLLVDDTWTSGSSMRSAAAALKLAGADSVVGLTIGRQLNTAGGYGTTGMILEQLVARSSDGPCLLCA